MKQKIYTLTLNPSIDMILNIEELNLKTKYDVANDISYFAGGKGINVSKVVNQFKVPTKILHCSGGFTGKYIVDEINKEGIKQIFFDLKKDTRINIKLNIGKEEMKEIDGNAIFIPNDIQEKILSAIDKIKRNEIIVITGSFNNKNKDLIFKISEKCFKKGVKIVYDLSSDILLELLKFNPILIKPNIYELNFILKKKISTEEEIIKSLKKLNILGAKEVAITLGKEGSYFIDENENIYKIKLKKEIKNISSQGAGDSFVGAFLSNLNLTKIEQLRIASAAGSSTVSKKGIANIDEINNMVKNIVVEKIN